MKTTKSILILFLFTFTTVINAQNHPFPQQVAYGSGIKPTSQTQTVMNSDVQTKFQQWRARYVVSNLCPTNTKRIDMTGSDVNSTCSEGISYGLTTLVFMDNSTNNTKADYDAVFGYYKSFLNGRGLMKWKILSTGLPQDSTFAGDGDELVAFSLLMADKQWGSTGTINYLNEAIRIIKQLEKYNVQPNYTFADGWGGWIFPAYQMPYAMKEFGVVNSNTTGWNSTISKAYTLFNYFYNFNSGTSRSPKYTGLMYDTCTPTYAAVDTNHKYYGFDACRVPWHLALDYLWNGTSQSTLAQTHPTRISAWAKSAWSNNPSNAKQRYNLNGTVPSGTYTADYGSMVGPMMVGAMASTDQTWLNTLYNFCRGLSVGSNYFADNILMINMIIASGNMPNFRSLAPLAPAKIKANPLEFSILSGESNKLIINFSELNPTSQSIVQLYDINGKYLFTKSCTGNQIIISKSDFKSGIYIISLKNNGRVASKKIIID